jgi:hypothetical protein
MLCPESFFRRKEVDSYYVLWRTQILTSLKISSFLGSDYDSPSLDFSL